MSYKKMKNEIYNRNNAILLILWIQLLIQYIIFQIIYQLNQ
jgi:hypothetical protein